MSEFGYTPLRVDYLERAEKNFANYRKNLKASASQYPLTKMERPPITKGLGLQNDLTTGVDLRSKHSITGYGSIGTESAGEGYVYDKGMILGKEGVEERRQRNQLNQEFSGGVSGMTDIKDGHRVNSVVGGSGVSPNALIGVLAKLNSDLVGMNSSNVEIKDLLEKLMSSTPKNMGQTPKSNPTTK